MSSDPVDSIPSLDRLSTDWLVRRRGLSAALPGLTHETGSIQAEADLCAIKHPVFPPYSGGGEITGQVLFGDRLLCQLAPEVRIRWTAWKLERTCEHDGWSFSSETCLAPNEAVAIVRWTVRNRSARTRTLSWGLALSGRGRNTGTAGYAWSVPEVPVSVWHLRDRMGLAVATEPGPLPDSILFSARDEPAFSLQLAGPGARWDADRATLRWNKRVSAGGQWSGFFLAAYGASKTEVVRLAQGWHPERRDGFAAARAVWDDLWKSAFVPGNDRFSGHLPVVESSDEFIGRLYYAGILTLLCLRRRYAGALLNPAYLTISPRRGEGSVYLAWDLPYISPILARLDPDALADHWAALCTAPLFSSMTLNLFDRTHLSFPCVADPLARVAPLRELARRGRLGDALSRRIRRTGRPLLAFPRDADPVYGRRQTRGVTGREALLEAATAHRRFPLGRTGLVDFGDRGNYLECCTTYAHGTAGHTAAQAWALEAAEQITGRRVANRGETDRLCAAVRSLYRTGEGYFDCLHPDGKRRPAPNLYDLGLVLQSLGRRLDADAVRDIARFVERHLRTPTWARCLAAFDPDTASGMRADHQWAGCFPAWPPQFIAGLHRAGHRPGWVAEWVEGMGRIPRQGPFAQAYFAEDVVAPERGAAAKSWDELPQGNHWMCSSGSLFSHVVLECLLGYDGRRTHPWPGLSTDCCVRG
jgi:hypothetical protein